MSGGFGVDRLARRMLADAQRLTVPELDDNDVIVMPDPLLIAEQCGLLLDPWQQKVVTYPGRKQILNCCRQSGKSTTTAFIADLEAVYVPRSLVLLLSPSQRQSVELFRKVMEFYRSMESPPCAVVDESTLRVEFTNGSRVIALPGSEATTRGYSAATLVIVDEASRVPDALIAAVRPALATTNGRMIVLSTPAGQRGWFYDTWLKGEGWERTEVTASDCPRITPEFLEEERRELGEFQYAAEYECQFQDVETAVFSSALIRRALEDDTVLPLFPVAPPREAA